MHCSIRRQRVPHMQWGKRYTERSDDTLLWYEAPLPCRFLMILDGNSFSSRLPTFLSSGSLLFRAGLFAEWFDERLAPMQHYLPVRCQRQHISP